MRPRAELAVAAGALALLLAISVATGRSVRSTDDPDPRASSYATTREGVRGTADALERLGLTVERWRERPRALRARGVSQPTTLAVLAPSRAPSPDEWATLLALATDSGGFDLVLAGESVRPLVQCFGFTIVATVFDSVRALPPGRAARDDDPWVHAHLVPFSLPDSARRSPPSPRSDEALACPSVPRAAVDTVLVTTSGKLAVARLRLEDVDRHLLLVADAALLRNRVMRASASAPLLLDAIAGRSRRVVFDEFHHGYGKGGSMAAVFLSWSTRSPLGWMMWQVTAVGFLALLAGAVRFGAPRPGIPRTRRSPLEHVRALATALSASRGHEVAIDAIVRGLRRRLAPATSHAAGAHAADEWRPWLDSLVRHAPTARARASAEALRRAADSPQPDSAVLAAANAVEDLWTDLHP